MTPPVNPESAPRPLEQEQWTSSGTSVCADGRWVDVGSEAIAVEIRAKHNTSLRALQEELVAAKLRIKDLEGKEA